MEAREVIELDGAAGEGGGQILRTALSLSATTGIPFRVSRIRAGRSRPGLRPQHLAAARATAAICGGQLTGDSVGSTEIFFSPRGVTPTGPRDFDIGTAGSAPLLLQTLCWPLALAGAPTQLRLRGGTHQEQAPSFHYLALVWAPAVARLGFPVTLSLQRAGFYPEGGGEFTATIEPPRALPALELEHRGTLLEAQALSLVAGLPFEVAEQQAARAEQRMREQGVSGDVRAIPMPSGPSRGSHLLVVARFERVTTGHSATSAAGRGPEVPADAAVADLTRLLGGHAAVDRHLGDQLLLPAALVAAGRVPRPEGVDLTTRYTVIEVTPHLVTNARVLERFLPVRVEVEGPEGGEGTVRVLPRPANGT